MESRTDQPLTSPVAFLRKSVGASPPTASAAMDTRPPGSWLAPRLAVRPPIGHPVTADRLRRAPISLVGAVRHFPHTVSLVVLSVTPVPPQHSMTLRSSSQ